VLDQARLGATMENEFGKSYVLYKSEMDNMAADRQDSIARRQREAAEAENALGPTRFASATLSADAGQAELRAAKKLRDMADAVAKQEQVAIAITAKSSQAPPLKPLPQVLDKTLVAQKAFAYMGEEQSITTRVTEYSDFYKTVKKGIDENNKKIKEAK